jgi:hypothetical protein
MYDLAMAATAVYKRTLEVRSQTSGNDMPPWAWFVLLLDFIVFFPVILALEYTFRQVFPVFAMVEDENPPAYEPVALTDDAAQDGNTTSQQPISGSKPTGGEAKPVSASICSVNRLLRANGGYPAYFRGIRVAFVQGIFTALVMTFFAIILPTSFTPVATLLAFLTLANLHTVWVHIILSKGSDVSFWQRAPTLRRAFEATWRPVVLFWAASEITRWMPLLVAPLFNLDIPSFPLDNETPEPPKPHDTWKYLAIGAASLVANLVLVVPARVILVRVQASLLPPEAVTIIPFDRTFQGTVAPALVDGRGYVTVKDAWNTFSRAAWKRLMILYVKIYAFSMAVWVLFAVVVFAELSVITAMATDNGDL